MTVRHEVKGQLAKLLATEDLIVESKKVETACFNVHTRVLTLPMWDKASNNVYDALVGHEVGHALFTPDSNWFEEIDIPMGIVNVVEDARIEKMMKRKYAGLSKTFYSGYHELSDSDFFKIQGKNLNTFNFADRVNLYYKIGNYNDIPLKNDREKELLSMVGATETFEDVLDVSKLLHEYCKQEIEDMKKELEQKMEEEEQAQMFGGSGSGLGGSSDENSDEEINNDTQYQVVDAEEEDDESDFEDQPSSNISISQIPAAELDAAIQKIEGGEGGIEISSATALDRSIQNLNKSDSVQNEYFELPQVNTGHIIIDNAHIHKCIELEWSEQITNKKTHQYLESEYDPSKYVIESLNDARKDFKDFKKSAQKEVNYLVKEFEMKKSASAYARAATSRTGVLDTTKLHTYKYNEDLFKKVTVLPDGKNHGLVFILDWSGSMNSVMLDTVKQLYNLIWFCRKIQVPFEVYAFTNCYPNPNTKTSYEVKEGVAQIDGSFSLMNLLTHKVNTKTLESQMENIYLIAKALAWQYTNYYNIPLGMGLSGTPLNETLVCLHEILPQFKKDNQVEKVQCVILTDGEAHPLRFHHEFSHRWGEECEKYMGTSYIGENCILRDRKTGNTYAFDDNSFTMTDVLLQNLRDKFTDVNFIGFRILPPREASYFAKRYVEYGDELEKIMKVWRKEKSFAIKKSGYHVYFGLSASALDSDDTFEVKEDATKTDIKKAFFKSLKGKKMNKKILSEFIEFVA
ncbi:MAG: hypothetical protein CM15mV14_0540 [uncultured marine virus]|nr:MAG: hypothetical protein CM15mV14_0540 [uncultured marine virus]